MSYIDNWNYLNDPRTQGPADDTPVLYLDDGDMVLPTHWQDCDLCHGEGSHVNPSIDSGGLRGDYADDPDFRRDYLSGKYDVPCNRCGGKRVVREVNWDALSEEHQKAYEDQLQAEYESRQETLNELRMGA